jgi:hypothetical protein
LAKVARKLKKVITDEIRTIFMPLPGKSLGVL